MPEYDKNVVAPLLRRRAHLEEVGADAAKLAELDHMLRMAGYPADDDSSLKARERVVQEKPGVPRADEEQTIMDDDKTESEARKVAPKERSASPGQETTAETKQAKRDEDEKAGRVQPSRKDDDAPAKSEDGTDDLASPKGPDENPNRSKDGTKDTSEDKPGLKPTAKQPEGSKESNSDAKPDQEVKHVIVKNEDVK